MEMIVQKSLIEWKERVGKDVEVLEEDLKGLVLGCNKDVMLSELLGKKRAIIEGIEKELKNSKRRGVLKIRGKS